MEKFAVVKHGKSQYIAIEGKRLDVDKIKAEPGSTYEIPDVLLFVDKDEIKVGKPNVSGIKVTCKVVKHSKDTKITSIQYHAKARYRRKRGHKQEYTQLLVESISSGASTKKTLKVSKVSTKKTAPTRKVIIKKPAAKVERKVAPKAKAVRKTTAKRVAKSKPKAATKRTLKKAK